MTLHVTEQAKIGASMEDLKKIFAPEKLNPALAAHLHTTKGGWEMVNHPLVQCILYSPPMNRMLNRQYEAKLKHLATAILEKDWESYIFLHERPYRAGALAHIMHRVSDSEYWLLVRHVWMDTENLWQWGTLKRRILMAKRPMRELLMNEAERQMIDSLEEVAPLIFRGYASPGRIHGWSWTFDRKKAEWFALRYSGVTTRPRVAIAEVYRRDIVAYFEGRREWEVVVDPQNIRVMEVQKVLPVLPSIMVPKQHKNNPPKEEK